MWKPLSHTRLLRYAGLFTWGMVGVPLVYLQVVPEATGLDGVPGTPQVAWVFTGYLGFGACYSWLTRGLGRSNAHWYDRVLLVVLTGCAIALSFFSGTGLGSILLMVAAGVIPWLLPPRMGLIWLLLSQLAVLPVYRWILGMPLFEATMQSLLYGGFSMFIFATSYVACQQTQAREEQRRLNAELRATRVLLAESARVNERTRISRELHDLLGHHLTALSLNLEVASHVTEGRALEHVLQSQALAKLLLTDVREAVSQLRESGAIDLAVALRPLVEQVPSPRIHLDVEEPLLVDDPERAHVLLRCIQEIITNAVRHAGARNLWIRVARETAGVRVDARDDGVGAAAATPGNGLRGMRERVLQLGGTMTVDAVSGRGFHLDVTVPSVAPSLPSLPEGVSP